MANHATDFKFFTAQELSICNKAHLKLLVLINFKEFAEALFEDGVSKRVSHDIVAASLLEAGLHFDNANLVECGHKEIKHDSLLLGSNRKIVVVLDGQLVVLSIFPVLLDVQVLSNPF